MQTRRILYWALAGALMGFGYIAILSIGSPFLLLGLGLVIFGLIRRWFTGFWAFLIGFRWAAGADPGPRHRHRASGLRSCARWRLHFSTWRSVV